RHADAHVVDLAVAVAALLAREHLERLVLRADRVVALLRERKGDLLVALAVHEQERARDPLHYSVQTEAFEALHRFLARVDAEDPEQVPPRHRERRRLAGIELVEAVLPCLPVVPLRAPGETAGEALLEGGGARRIVAAKADRHDADALRIDLGARGEIFVRGARVALGVVTQVEAAEAHALAVARAIDDQARDAARRQVRNALEVLDLLGDVEAVEEHHGGHASA